MSDLIARAKAALEDISDGPWHLHDERGHYGVTNITEAHAFGNVVFAQSDYAGYGNGSRKADAQFIAAARTLVPDLIDRLEFMENELEYERDRVSEHFEARMDAEARDMVAKVVATAGDLRVIVPILRELIAELARRPLVPITDDLASERLDGVRDERDELLVRVDELKAELDAVRAERDTARAATS